MKRTLARWKIDRSCPSWRLCTRSTDSGLLDDVAHSAAFRLSVACFLYAFGYLVAFFGSGLHAWFTTGIQPEYLTSYRALIAAASIAVAIGLVFVFKLKQLSSSQVLHLGLAFEVVGAFGISLATFWGVFPTEIISSPEAAEQFMTVDLVDRCRLIGIPWTCIWIVCFAFLAPCSHKKAAVPSLLAASTGLIVVLISRHSGATSPYLPISFFVRYFLFSTYLCALIACATGHNLDQINHHLRQAREYGSYKLKSLLGKGGMGEVWLAEHSMLARPAAVKLIHEEVLGTDPQTRESVTLRFKREALATSALRSIHTIDIYDFGTSKGGLFYYVMELLDGLNLDQLVERFGPVSAGRTVYILRQVCHSLIDAHENDMIHRDIKPANIYLCKLGPDNDFVKVLDFGLVKTGRLQSDDATSVTMFGSTIGSPSFMAPEMALGKKEVDARLDLYALGCVGYWLLTGQLVFRGENSIATLVQHVQATPDPPSSRTELDIPPELEKIIMSCLAKDPDDRPQTARALDKLLADCPLDETWGKAEADEWWSIHLPNLEALNQPPATEPTKTL